MLADRGLGAAYVGVAPGQTAGVTALPLSTLWTGTPILSNPFGRNGAKPLSKRHFHFTFGNDLSRAASDALWERYAVNSYNRVFFEGVTSVLDEKGGVTHVDYARADRAPLLLIAGEIDHVVPPTIVRAIEKKYRSTGSPAIVERKEYAGRTHRLVSQDGWEEIADYALTWAVAPRRHPSPDAGAVRPDGRRTPRWADACFTILRPTRRSPPNGAPHPSRTTQRGGDAGLQRP